MELRVRKCIKGWIVEYKKHKWSIFGLKTKWIHVTSYAGIYSEPFYYKTPEGAREGALRCFKDKINYSFYFS